VGVKDVWNPITPSRGTHTHLTLSLRDWVMEALKLLFCRVKVESVFFIVFFG
jgi:hypothetical protein